MDVIQKNNVKIPNSVIVSGVTNTENDEELYDFLKQYGSIQRTIPVDPSEPESGRQVIVEFTYGTAIQSLSPSLPGRLDSESNAGTTYLIRALASVYTPMADGAGAASLEEEPPKISCAVNPDAQWQPAPEAAVHVSPLPIAAPEKDVQTRWSASPTTSVGRNQPTLRLSDVNPPEIQKVIVEHIVRNEDSALQVHTSLRLRPFSGRVPRPNESQ